MADRPAKAPSAPPEASRGTVCAGIAAAGAAVDVALSMMATAFHSLDDVGPQEADRDALITLLGRAHALASLAEVALKAIDKARSS